MGHWPECFEVRRADLFSLLLTTFFSLAKSVESGNYRNRMRKIPNLKRPGFALFAIICVMSIDTQEILDRALELPAAEASPRGQ